MRDNLPPVTNDDLNAPRGIANGILLLAVLVVVAVTIWRVFAS